MNTGIARYRKGATVWDRQRSSSQGAVVDLPTLIACHQLSLNAEGRTRQTQRQYFYFHCKFLEYLEQAGITPTLDALSPANLRDAAIWYRAQPDPRRSRDGEVAARALVDLTKRLGSFGEEEGVFEDNPLRRVKRPTISRHERTPFSVQEINAIWSASTHSGDPLRDEAMVLVLLDTGMRIGELCSLTRADLHLSGDDRYVQVGARGKGRRDRRVPLGDASKRDGGRTVRALRALLEHRDDGPRGGDAVWLGREGYALTAKGGYEIVHRLGELAGVPNAYPHRFRHTFCTNYLILFPGDEIGLRRIVGHLSSPVLSQYVHFAHSVISQRSARASLAESLLGAGALSRLA